jgi:hypothetical protein
LTLSENSSGYFSGQYILAWSHEPPVVSDIPDHSVAEGSPFAAISLDAYVDDPDNADSEITWTTTDPSNLNVDIADRVATVTSIDPDWNGSETITFQAEDPDGSTDADPVTFTVTPVNDPPVVDAIPFQSIPEGEPFSQIQLDDYVLDVDDADQTLIWSVSGDSHVTVDITDRVATINVNDPEWNGTDWVIFIATDPGGLQGSDTVRFEVGAVNDPPVVDDIPGQVIVEGQHFSQINLDNFVADPDHADDSIQWTVAGSSAITVSIVDRIANLTVDPDWYGSETIVFTAEDPLGARNSDTAVFQATQVNDPPALTAIPDESITEGTSFTAIHLDEYVDDVDDSDACISWTVSGEVNLHVSITDRVANISTVDPDWNGQETLVFTAADPQGASGRDTAVFTVTGVNDAPVMALPIPDTTARIGQAFLFILDPNTFTDADPEDQLVLSASMVVAVGTPAWLSFNGTSGTFSGTPIESDTGLVEAIVTAMDTYSESISDTFYIRVEDATGLAGWPEGLGLSLYPNPSTGQFMIEAQSSEGMGVFLEIFNEQGKVLWSRKIMDAAGTIREQVDLSHAGDGLYLLRLRNRAGMTSRRFVISR